MQNKPVDQLHSPAKISFPPLHLCFMLLKLTDVFSCSALEDYSSLDNGHAAAAETSFSSVLGSN